ncbi:PREDICTED: lipid transfer-like protein VAS [Nelumbo nucifera]|nr:PREDICTED: lipid transfer-like protein VAS [Nelumbo nucifera]
MDCLEKLLPCESYLKPPVSPPSSCCVPLKEMIKDDPNCLCSIFNDVDLLKSLNVSQSDLLELPKACGANVDISICSKAVAPITNSPATASNGSSSSKSTNIPASKSLAFGIYLSGAWGFFAIFTSLVLLVF